MRLTTSAYLAVADAHLVLYLRLARLLIIALLFLHCAFYAGLVLRPFLWVGIAGRRLDLVMEDRRRVASVLQPIVPLSGSCSLAVGGDRGLMEGMRTW